jgi:hypothetical protein
MWSHLSRLMSDLDEQFMLGCHPYTDNKWRSLR